MAKINLNALPDELPGSSPVFPKGKYKVTVEKASMMTPKDVTKDLYLSVQYQVTDPDTDAPVAKFWDKFYSSANQYTQFKLKRFIQVMGLPLKPNDDFELSDIEKMTNMKVGKSFYADFSVNDKDGKNEMQIDIFMGKVYYPLDTETTAPAPTVAAPSAEMPVFEEEPAEADESDY